MHVLRSSFEEIRSEFISEKSQNNLRVPNILEGNVSFLKNEYLAFFIGIFFMPNLIHSGLVSGPSLVTGENILIHIIFVSEKS